MKLSRARRRWLNVTTVALLLGWLAACSLQGTREMLGMGKQVPDEYLVVEHAPLSLPPNFDLRPPRPGAAGAQYVDLRKRAERILRNLSSDSPPSTSERTISEGEIALLTDAGALNVDSKVRSLIDGDNGDYVAEDERFVDDLMFWQGDDESTLIVDPVAEAKRLRVNAAAGLPVTYGNTPTIERKE